MVTGTTDRASRLALAMAIERFGAFLGGINFGEPTTFGDAVVDRLSDPGLIFVLTPDDVAVVGQADEVERVPRGDEPGEPAGQRRRLRDLHRRRL